MNQTPRCDCLMTKIRSRNSRDTVFIQCFVVCRLCIDIRFIFDIFIRQAASCKELYIFYLANIHYRLLFEAKLVKKPSHRKNRYCTGIPVALQEKSSSYGTVNYRTDAVTFFFKSDNSVSKSPQRFRISRNNDMESLLIYFHVVR
jgi:hypothetical protein